MSVMDETYRLRTYVDACTDHEMLLTSNPPKHRVTCTDVDIKPLIDAIESAYADDVMAAENRGYESGCNEGVASKHCIELPKDADGDVWHVGDLVVGEVNPNNPKRVERMLWYGPDSGWQLETDSIIYPCPERSRHHKPPTVKDVLREFAKSIADTLGGDEFLLRDDDEMYAEFVERLQLREED